MAVTQRKRTVVNPAGSKRRRLTPKQIKAGFGGKRRQAAAKRRKPAAAHHHTVAKKRATRPNLGKIISFTLPKESNTVAKTKRNTAKMHNKPAVHLIAKKNPTHSKRTTKRNPSMGDLTGLVSSAVFTIAGAVGSKYLTQTVLSTSNTGITGYFGNLVSALALSWGVKSIMKNDKAAAAVLSGGIVQIVLRLIADYTPFGQYTSNLGMGDYLAQNFAVPQRLKPVENWQHSALLDTAPMNIAGMSGCAGVGAANLYGSNSLY